MRDLHNNLKASVALNTQAISTDTTTAGAIIDTANYDSLEFVVLFGTLTDGTYTLLVEDGDASNLSDAAAVADAQLIGTEGTIAATADNTVTKIGYNGIKRYVRLSIVSASTTSGGTMGAIALQGTPANAPVS